MDNNILAALIGAGVAGLVSMVALFLNNSLEQKKDDEARRRELKIAYLERQIEELYGPVWGLIEQSRRLYEVTCKDLPRHPDGRLARDQFTREQTVEYNFIKENYFIPIHTQIAEILCTKMHLVDQKELPDSFVEFFGYAALTRSSYQLMKEKQIGHLDQMVKKVKWPHSFNQDIKRKLEELRMEHHSRIEDRAAHAPPTSSAKPSRTST